MSVSDNDLQAVSSGDAEVFQIEAFQEDISVSVDELQSLNYTCTAILFFIIFSWIESRIRSAVREVFKNGKSD